MMADAETTPFAASCLRRFATAVLGTTGVRATDAELIADSLVQAELWGHGSHGIMRLPSYVERLRVGVMKATATPELVVDAGAVAVLDGHDGIGQVVAAEAARTAIGRALHYGVSAVAARNSNHFGTAAYFTRMGPAAGCVAILTTNASPAMAPWGGGAKRVGANPWSIAAPAGHYGTAVLDIANTVAARGKITLARLRQAAIPEDWALDVAGKTTTDPVEALGGCMLPMGGHKGYAIAFMLDVLSGVLSGSSFGSEVGGPYQSKRRAGVGHLFIALNIGSFMPLPAFNARMEALVRDIKSVPPVPGCCEVSFPGEPESQRAAQRMRDGLAVPSGVVMALQRLAQETGVALDQPPEKGLGAV